MAEDPPPVPPPKNEVYLSQTRTTSMETKVDVVSLKGDAPAKDLLELAKVEMDRQGGHS